MQFSDELETWTSRARSVADGLSSRAAAFEAEERVPAEVYSALASDGLMAVAIDREYGGAGLGALAYSRAMSEIARGCPSTAVTMAVTNMVGEVIQHFGTAEQKRLYCPQLAAGGHGAFALSEPGAGSDPAAMMTRAESTENGYVLRGVKQWISHGDTANVFVVWAKLGDAAAHRSITCFLVSGDNEGVRRGNKEDKMGLRASHTVALELDDVVVGKDALLGEMGGGFRIAMMALDGGRIGIASQALGIFRRAYEETMAALGERAAKLDQGDQFVLADARMTLDAMKLLVLRAATLKQDKKLFSEEASIAKAFASERAWKSIGKLRVLLMRNGIECAAVDRAFRDVRVTMIYEGTSEIQRLVIARQNIGKL